MPLEITGKILNDLGFPATGGYKVRAMEYAVGKDDPQQLGADIPISADGSYKVQLDKSAVNMHLQIVDANGQEVGRTPMQQIVTDKTQVYWAVPSRKEQSEYQRLRSDVQTRLGLTDEAFKATLLNLKENPDKSRRDFTLLSQQVGWDARVIAMMARAEKLSDGDPKMREFYYAAFRAGLPLEEGQEALLHRAETGGLIAAWKQATTDKIISADFGLDATLNDAATKFQSKAQAFALDYKAAGSKSSVGDLLSLTLHNAADRTRFMNLYSNWKAPIADFWKKLPEQNFQPQQIKALQIDAQLANLTLNNVPLIQKLKMAILPMDDLVRLVLAGFFKIEKWTPFVTDTDVVEAVEGADISERRRRYIQLMADQLRKSYPTAVMATLVNEDTLPVAATEKAAVVAYLMQIATMHIGQQDGKPYEFGMKLLKNTDGFVLLAPTVQTELKKLERTFQLTPDDLSMQVLLNQNLHAAVAIVKKMRTGFLQQFGHLFHPDKLKSQQIAQSIYQKALQIHTATLNIAIAMATYKGNPLVQAIDGVPVPALSTSTAQPMTVDPRSVLNYPTLDTLFGNLDYCECSECRSVLSPAAYLVDLLQFIDRDHDLDGLPLPNRPLDVLLERRPDIADLELSCENTNTAMPYIDLVNEVMEYYIQNNANIQGLKPFNVSEGTASADLIAAPQRSLLRQNIATVVYDTTLKNAKTPLRILPFHYALEQLRAWYNVHNTPLATALWTFQAPQTDMLLEQLQLSRDQFNILTQPIGADALTQYFDYVPSTPALGLIQRFSELSNARILAQSLGLTYQELIELLKQPFINPTGLPSTLILLNDEEVKFKFLNLTLAQAALIVQTPAARVTLPLNVSPALFDNDPTAWLRRNFNLINDLQNNVVSMDKLWLRRNTQDLSQNQPTALDFLKLMRFVRLWRTTAWSLPEFARLGTVLVPESDFATLTDANVDNYFRALTYRFCFVRRVQNQLGLAGNKGLEEFMQMWQNNPIFLSRPAEQRQYDALARLLKINAADLRLWMGHSEVWVFRVPLLDNVGNIMTLGQLLDCIERVKKVKAAKIKAKEWNYIAYHNDVDGKFEPSLSNLQAVILQIKAALRQIESDLSQVSDLDGLRLRIGQVFDTSMTDLFFELLTDQKTFVASLDLEEMPVELDEWVLRSRLSFDNFSKTIAVKGRLKMVDFNNLLASAMVSAPVQTALRDLVQSGQQSITDFLAQFPSLAPAFNGFEEATTTADKFKTLLERLLPNLKKQLQVQAVRQIVATATKAAPELIAALIEDSEVLNALASESLPIVTDLLSFDAPADFFLKGGTVLLEAMMSEDYEMTVETKGDFQMTLAMGNQIVIDGAIQSGMVRRNTSPLRLKAGQLYRISLNLMPTQPNPMTGMPGGGIPPLVMSLLNEPVVLKMRHRNTAQATLITPQLIGVDNYNLGILALQRIFKAVQCTRLFRLNALEINYLCRQPAFKWASSPARSFLNVLPVSNTFVKWEVDIAVETALNLVDYVLLRDRFDNINEGLLLTLLQNPNLLLTNGKSVFCEALNATRADVEALLTRFTGNNGLTGLTNLKLLNRVMEAMELISNWNGATANDLLTWTKHNPVVSDITALKNTLQPLYELQLGREAWRNVLQTANDPLRSRQRDALVGWILSKHKSLPLTDSRYYANTLDKLFEYFLIDPGMEPMIQTSPIRQALSAVQLFIHRSLLNLEPLVSPRAIPTAQWTWMKRYRVWEANRKVFLFPENWLEPALRDNKSPFFKDFENELLQSDMTDELAETAYLHYLQKLDDVAKLEICGMYVDERDLDTQVGNRDDIVHVFGRTNGNSRRFFYRRYESGSWTAWEKVDLPIEDDQVMPVVWKNRLFLFWLNWRAIDATMQNSIPDAKVVREVTVGEAKVANLEKTYLAQLSWSELFNGKWQSPRSTEGEDMTFKNVKREAVALNCHVFMAPVYKNQILEIHVGNNAVNYVKQFFNKNSNPDNAIAHTDLVQWKNSLHSLYGNESAYKQHRGYKNSRFEVNIKQPQDASKEFVTTRLFDRPGGEAPFLILPPPNPMQNVWEAPFFYHDSTHVFSSTAEETSFDAVWKVMWYYEPPRLEIPKRYREIEPIITQDFLRLPTVVAQIKGLDQVVRRVNGMTNVIIDRKMANFNIKEVSVVGNPFVSSPVATALNPSVLTAIDIKGSSLASGSTIGGLATVLSELNVVDNFARFNNVRMIAGVDNPINNGLTSVGSLRLGGSTLLNIGGGFTKFK